ncbi:uncharacterized protein LOC124293440 [Neodiprion lecontei]|uniref:Uncharacterized protein LOC124293440 n=1 Tax=Neodiprion lecontei TaxID=441921 RepID=A0ABM3FQH5_NEOLC|nr:uncharacterized protein LOC124293440 [Neodiprion lecontei]
MAASTSLSGLQTIEKLKGRENYDDWAVAMKAYLTHEDLWDFINPDNAAAVPTDPQKDKKTRAKIILAVERQVYGHVRDLNTARDVWLALKKTYADTGVTRGLQLIKLVTDTKLENCSSEENYIDTIVSAAHQLKSIGLEFPDKGIGAILLNGLPEVYKPMVMALESSKVDLTTDLVKTKILQDVKWFSTEQNNDLAFFSRANAGYKQNRGRRGVQRGRSSLICYRCNRPGHYARNCRRVSGNSSNWSQNNNNSGNNRRDGSGAMAAQGGDEEDEYESAEIEYASVSLIALGTCSSDSWMIDSAASRHMCNNTSRGVPCPLIGERGLDARLVGEPYALVVAGFRAFRSLWWAQYYVTH